LFLPSFIRDLRRKIPVCPSLEVNAERGYNGVSEFSNEIISAMPHRGNRRRLFGGGLYASGVGWQWRFGASSIRANGSAQKDGFIG
jgi:hypothetical protein